MPAKVGHVGLFPNLQKWLLPKNCMDFWCPCRDTQAWEICLLTFLYSLLYIISIYLYYFVSKIKISDIESVLSTSSPDYYRKQQYLLSIYEKFVQSKCITTTISMAKKINDMWEICLQRYVITCN